MCTSNRSNCEIQGERFHLHQVHMDYLYIVLQQETAKPQPAAELLLIIYALNAKAWWSSHSLKAGHCAKWNKWQKSPMTRERGTGSQQELGAAGHITWSEKMLWAKARSPPLRPVSLCLPLEYQGYALPGWRTATGPVQSPVPRNEDHLSSASCC